MSRVHLLIHLVPVGRLLQLLLLDAVGSLALGATRHLVDPSSAHDCILAASVPLHRTGDPTRWILSMFVVVFPAGDAAAITTASPGSAKPCA